MTKKTKTIKIYYNAELNFLTTFDPEPNETIVLLQFNVVWFYIGEL
jgi:hypothetical protein